MVVASATWSISENLCSVLVQPCTIGALIITYTILGVPYYNYSIMGPKLLRPLYYSPTAPLNFVRFAIPGPNFGSSHARSDIGT